MKPTAPAQPAQVFAAAPFSEDIAKALKAIAAGNASPGQQKDGLNWICEKAGGFFQDGFIPGQPDAAQYLAGRRSVTLQIRHILQIPLTSLKKETT